MARPWLLLALVAPACDAPAPPPPAPPVHWVYPPAPTGWPLAAARGRIGRAQPPQVADALGIAGPQRVPLHAPTVWEVPGEPARAVVYGLEGARPAIELVDIDAGTVRWRDATACTGPIVGVTSAAIVCSDGAGVRGVALDGKAAWRSERGFVVMTDDRIVVAGDGAAVILDAATGDELSRVTLPPAVPLETIVATCGDAGRELFAATPDRKLVRIADIKGKPAIAWSVPLATLGTLDADRACVGDSVLVPALDGALVALARATGVQTGRVEGVRGAWPARDGSGRIELATAGGVASWSRDLVDERGVLPLPLGALLAQRGERRLVRATPRTAVLLDRAGVAAYVTLDAEAAALGDHALVAGTWSGSPAHVVRRLALPPRYRRVLRVGRETRGIGLPAELRDLPPAVPLAEASALAKPDTGAGGVGPVAIDRATPSTIYVAAYGARVDDDTPTALAAVDLARSAWTWERSDGCAGGEVVALAVGRDVVLCGAQGKRPGTGSVRATSRDGAARWEWEGDALERVVTAGELAIVFAAERAFVLDAATGRPRFALAAADAGRVLATALDTAAWGTLVIAVEHGRLVARAARLDFLPVWSLAIDGVAARVDTAADGVLVVLEDGDAYRVLADGTVVPVPGLAAGYLAGDDVLVATAPGGPIYGPPVPPAARRVPLVRRTAQGKPLAPLDPELPSLWTPIPPPPIARASLQLTFYDVAGGVRARADYDAVAVFAPRGPAGSAIVVDETGAAARAVIVLDPRTGDPLRRVALPEGARPFSTVVAGTPVAGALLGKPLRVVLF